jgi:hypothetical protein
MFGRVERRKRTESCYAQVTRVKLVFIVRVIVVLNRVLARPEEAVRTFANWKKRKKVSLKPGGRNIGRSARE